MQIAGYLPASCVLVAGSHSLSDEVLAQRMGLGRKVGFWHNYLERGCVVGAHKRHVCQFSWCQSLAEKRTRAMDLAFQRYSVTRRVVILR